MPAKYKTNHKAIATFYNTRKILGAPDPISRKPGSGGHNRKRTQAFLDDVENRIKKDPTSSMRKMAAELNVDERTIRKAVHDDLGLDSYARTPRHLLTDTMKTRRLERCKKVLNFFKGNGDTVKIYSDKKIFTVDAVRVEQ